MKLKLTEQKIKAITPEAAPIEFWDIGQPGLVLRIQPSGSMTFYVVYRNEVNKRNRIALGKYGAITLSQARELAKKQTGAIAAGVDPQFEKKKLIAAAQEDEAKQITLQVFLDDIYTPWVKVNRKSAAHTLMLLKTYFPDFLPIAMCNLTLQQVEEWQIYQANRGLKPSSINRPLNALRSVFTRAAQLKVIADSPLNDLQNVPECDDVRVRHFSEEEERAIRAALHNRNQMLLAKRKTGNQWRGQRGYELMPEFEDHQYGDYLMPMVLLVMNTGLRRGECFQIRWCDVDFEQHMLIVRADNAKSGKARRIPLNEEAYKVLKNWRETNTVGDGLVFPGEEGQPMVTIKTAWGNLMRVTGIKDFRFHDLRHHFASMLAMKGVDLNLIRELLGHADFATTLRYAHVGDKQKANALALLVLNAPMY